MKKYFCIGFVILFLVNPIQISCFNAELINKNNDLFDTIWESDIILVSDDDPYYCLVGSTVACYYTSNSTTPCIRPLLVNTDDELYDQHHRFIRKYRENASVLMIGNQMNIPYNSSFVDGSPTDISIAIASTYKDCSRAIIVPYGMGDNYTNSLLITPLSSYLHIPLIVYDDNANEINMLIQDVGINELYIVGDIDSDEFIVESVIKFHDSIDISHMIFNIIKQKFDKFHYITVTNPSDIQPMDIVSTNSVKDTKKIKNFQCTIAGKSINFVGSPMISYNFTLPAGVFHVQCMINYSSYYNEFPFLSTVDPLLQATLIDTTDIVVGYSQSSAWERDHIFIDTLVTDQPGEYTVTVSAYQGLKGGFFSSRGVSMVDAVVHITIQLDQITSCHFPRVQLLSSLAPYMTSARGGVIIADESFSLTQQEYFNQARGFATGPWYEERLHAFNNNIVNQTILQIKDHLDMANDHDLLSSYLNGPAWCALLGDTNMIPMYYFHPSQLGLYEKGLPSDNPYSLNHTLSVGRMMGYSIDDVSNLICRTFFYEPLCSNPENLEWNKSFHFMYGEGFGETGGWFHQIPYAREIEQFGFDSEVFGDLRNSRQYAETFNVFTGANYNEYLGHGDWFWFIPSIYGYDMYSKAFDVAHVKEWIFEYPSIFLTSACLMGRVDGIPAWMNIGMTFLHAGCNAFVGSTRETGSEAGLELLENSLIVNNMSIGEALREEKRNDDGAPTYIVRTLYGDPAFNPYEPNNGFSSQGIMR